MVRPERLQRALKAHFVEARQRGDAGFYDGDINGDDQCGNGQKVLKIPDAQVVDIISTRCVHIGADERHELLNSQACDEILNDNSKGEVQKMITDLDNEEVHAHELQVAVRELRAKLLGPSAAKKPKLLEREWPKDSEITTQQMKDAVPHGAKAWYDPHRKRYQVFYQGSSVSRAVKAYGSNEAAKSCAQ